MSGRVLGSKVLHFQSKISIIITFLLYEIIPYSVTVGVKLDHTANRTRVRMVDCVLTVLMDRFVNVNRGSKEKGLLNLNTLCIPDIISSVSFDSSFVF